MAESKREPFRVATITLPDGGRLGLARLPGRYGDLDDCIAQIQTWPANAVVSMTPIEEMRSLGASGLPLRLQEADIAHYSFPVEDYGIPVDSAALWAMISQNMHERLDDNQSVLLHCRGGLGRSGMVAVRLLIERGMPPDVAFGLIRDRRPGAVETVAQETWARQGLLRQHIRTSRR
ncbi:CDC14 Predicted protein-tyrosine phosphatase [Rhabdaerophilaceae bacterium]